MPGQRSSNSHTRLPPDPLAAGLAIALTLAVSTPAPALERPAAGFAGPRISRAIDASLHAKARANRPAGLIAVTSCADSGPGSLRHIMFDAVAGDRIDMSGLACSTITLTSGAVIDFAESVDLLGPPGGLTLQGSGVADRVIVHNGSGTLALHGVHVTGGDYTGEYGGGCIYAYGNIYLGSSTVSGCVMTAAPTSAGNGGGIYARGSVQLANSSVSGNLARASAGASNGGGIWSRDLILGDSTVSGNAVQAPNDQPATGGGAYASGDILIDRSTLAANAAKSGSALFLTGADAHFAALLENSTVSGNQTTGSGAVFARSGLELVSCTIASNGGPRPSSSPIGFSTATGVVVTGENPVIQSSIIANNRETTDEGPRAADVGGDNDLSVAGAANLIGTSGLPVPADTLHDDPRLGPLQDNGGATLTHALLSGSTAIDHGNNVFGYETDQRGPGYARTIGANADIGAFEFGARPDVIFANGFE